MKNKVEIDKAKEDVEEILSCEVYLRSNSIRAFKYNYALEDIVQNFPCFEAFIQLSADSKYLTIMTKKPVEIKRGRDQKSEEEFEDEEESDQDFVNSKSSASCYISDIKGILVGGIDSRFWMLRKYSITLKRNQLQSLPFFAWQCLTIQLPYRDVNLVIPDDKQMDIILKFLIHKLRTFDGQRGSAENLLKAMNEQTFSDYKRQKKKVLIS